MTDMAYSDGWWESADGLRLHYRDYPGNKAKTPVICIPGLTRNARDFAHVAERLSPDRRVICVELRGRGESAYAPDPLTYTPATYAADLSVLFETLKLKKAVFIGTSLGGILTMLLALHNPRRIAGALLNDIGPEVEEAGLARIRGYVGRSQSWPTWVHAARAMQETQDNAFPGQDLAFWIAFAKRTCKLTSQGRIILDYDMKIAEPMRTPTPPVDLWPAFRALACPTAVVRGELSDILSERCFKAMGKDNPDVRLIRVRGVGHAPMLDEPEAVRAITALLKAVDG